MAEAIAWIGEPGRQGGWGDGRWGAPNQLTLPLDDRGLLLADGLFETVLVAQRQPQLLEAHHQRWCEGAAVLGMAPPPDLAVVQQLAAEAVARSGISTGALRLNWSRGSGGRGLDPPALDPVATGACRQISENAADNTPDPGIPHKRRQVTAAAGANATEVPTTGVPTTGANATGVAAGRFWLQLTACAPLFTPVRVIVSPTERRCASSELSRIKTFAYGSAIQARRQARAAGADDALLKSTAGGLCCGTAANLVLQVGGRWLTPSLASGCLPGVMRRSALEQGLVAEAPGPITAEALRNGTVRAALLLNSLGCRPIVSCDGVALRPAEGEAFWRGALEGGAGGRAH